MKITAVTPHIMWGGDAGGFQFSSTLWGRGAGRNWLFVKVETDAGVHGWGEASLVNQTPAIAASIELLGRQIMGQDPAAIERLWQVMYLHNRYRGGVVISSALSAIDQALWDIKGKVLDAPVYQLLGGAVRDTIRVYAGAGDPEQARERIAEGFAGVKTGGGWHGPDHAVDDRRAPETLRRELLAIREALPPDAELMVDNHGHSRPPDAIRQIRAVDDLGLLFFEEAVPPDNPDELALLRAAGLSTPLAAGERLHSRWAFRDLVIRQLVDVIQPDICHCGGISELRRIAALAEIYGITVAPHNPKGPVSTAASLHVCATIPNFLILEHAHANPLYDAVQVEPMRIGESGYAPPAGPGLGVDLDEEVIAAHPYRHRPVLQAYEADGTPSHP
ncbi:MAG: galactonate dehydratase [Spirochaetaceae bacterium]|nr:galactonate dehydratase [Spirochaetaceae bacterium]